MPSENSRFDSCQRLTSKGWRAFLLVNLVGLVACSAVPPSEPPALHVPAAFKGGVPGSSVWQVAQPHDAVPDDWWRLFNDPVLDQLQQQAQAANHDLALALGRLRAAHAALDGSRAAWWPTLGANAASTRSRSSTSSNASASTTAAAAPVNTSATVGLTASWELDVWGRVAAGVRAAQANVAASANDVAAMSLSVQASVAQTYFAVRAVEAQQRLLADTLAAYQRSWELTQNRYRAGVASSADVAQAHTQWLAVQAQQLAAHSSRAQLEHALAVLLGQAPASFTLAVTAELPPPPALPAQLPAQLLQRRPDIAAAQQRVQAANAQVGVARAAFFPQLSFSASAGYRAAQWADVLSAPALVWSLGPALAATLFDGGARSAALEQALAGVEQASASYRQTVLTALQEVEDNLVLGASLEREQAVHTEAVATAQRALVVVENQYRAGLVGYLNVLAAQATVLSAHNNLLSVRNRRLAASVVLLKNLAGDWQPTPTAAGPSPAAAAAPG